jgi:adenylate cyclase
MATEIERKFIVAPEKLPELMSKPRHIKQGYLTEGGNTCRIRILDDIEARLTIKGKGTLSRPEFEYTIPLEDAKELYKLSLYSLEKDRYTLEIGGKEWVVDKFIDEFGNVFWMAEIEMQSEHEEFESPQWILNDVTENSDYSNKNIAKFGIATLGTRK